MDWQNVTAEELVDALKEVDWKAPRPLWEFFSKFGPPKNQTKWISRLKCNVYYYRTNYLLILLLTYCLAFLRNPVALGATCICTFALLCFNDPFANALNDVVLSSVRRFNARAAQRLRNIIGSHASLGSVRRSKVQVKILGIPRAPFIGVCALGGLYLYYVCNGLSSLAWASLAGTILPLLHATFRSPNLKARLASAREEFRATWRGYQSEAVTDYTL